MPGMASVLLLLFVGGIAMTQAVSDPRAVTLRWLRLGGLIAVALLGVAIVIDVMAQPTWRSGDMAAYALVAATSIAQLMLTQLGRRHAQRIAAMAGYFIACAASWWLSDAQAHGWLTFVTFLLSAALLGGFLMTMLLGHAYLTSGNEMTQAPFERLVMVLVAILAARLLLSGAMALYPWLVQTQGEPRRLWAAMMLTARYAVGLAVPIIFALMSWECVRRRANQSATGILYVTSVLVVIGEGLALALEGTVGPGV